MFVSPTPHEAGVRYGAIPTCAARRPHSPLAAVQDPAGTDLDANLGRAAGQDDDSVFAVIWNPAD